MNTFLFSSKIIPNSIFDFHIEHVFYLICGMRLISSLFKQFLFLDTQHFWNTTNKTQNTVPKKCIYVHMYVCIVENMYKILWQESWFFQTFVLKDEFLICLFFMREVLGSYQSIVSLILSSNGKEDPLEGVIWSI